MVVYCWSTVCDAEPTLNQHCVDASRVWGVGMHGVGAGYVHLPTQGSLLPTSQAPSATSGAASLAWEDGYDWRVIWDVGTHRVGMHGVGSGYDRRAIRNIYAEGCHYMTAAS